MSDNRMDRGTAGSDLSLTALPAATFSETRISPKSLNEEAGSLRSRVSQLSDHTQNIHKDTAFGEWRDRTSARGKQSPTRLLDELSGWGFSWRDVARMLRVSVPAVRKWRKEERISGDNRDRLAGLVAACDQVIEDYCVEEVGSWFEMPLMPGVPITPVDLMADSRVDLLFEYASGHTEAEAVLSILDPEWRDRYRSDFEVFRAADGNLSLGMKD